MRMQTPGWDTVVRGWRDAILWPNANHVPHANIVPAWPRAWSDAMGHVSPTMHLDTYLQRLGETIGRHDKIPVHVLHDRADVTGSHDDQTYREGRWLLGPEGVTSVHDDLAGQGWALTSEAELGLDGVAIMGTFGHLLAPDPRGPGKLHARDVLTYERGDTGRVMTVAECPSIAHTTADGTIVDDFSRFSMLEMPGAFDALQTLLGLILHGVTPVEDTAHELGRRFVLICITLRD
jgi:hypothetical protein